MLCSDIQTFLVIRSHIITFAPIGVVTSGSNRCSLSCHFCKSRTNNRLQLEGLLHLINLLTLAVAEHISISLHQVINAAVISTRNCCLVYTAEWSVSRWRTNNLTDVLFCPFNFLFSRTLCKENPCISGPRAPEEGLMSWLGRVIGEWSDRW